MLPGACAQAIVCRRFAAHRRALFCCGNFGELIVCVVDLGGGDGNDCRGGDRRFANALYARLKYPHPRPLPVYRAREWRAKKIRIPPVSCESGLIEPIFVKIWGVEADQACARLSRSSLPVEAGMIRTGQPAPGLSHRSDQICTLKLEHCRNRTRIVSSIIPLRQL